MSNENFSFDLDSELDSIRQSASEPSEGVMAHAAQAEETNETPSGNEQRDSAGNIFNPAIHATDADGNPTKTVTGKFRKKRGSKVAQVEKQQQLDQQNAADRERKRQTGRTYADMMFSIGVLLGGEDWTPQGAENFQGDFEINEYNHVRNAFADWAEANDAEISPNKMLGIAVVGYVLPRLLTSQETHKRLGFFAGFVRPKLLKVRNWFKNRKGKDNAALVNSRNDGKRENDASETHGNESEASR